MWASWCSTAASPGGAPATQGDTEASAPREAVTPGSGQIVQSGVSHDGHLSGSGSDWHTEYVTELPELQKSIYTLVKSAQEQRGEANLKRAEANSSASARKASILDQDRGISNRLVPKTGGLVYRVIRLAGRQAFFSGMWRPSTSAPISRNPPIPIIWSP